MERLLRSARAEFFERHWVLNNTVHGSIDFRPQIATKPRDTDHITCIILCHPQDTVLATHFRQLLLHFGARNPHVSDPPEWSVFIITAYDSKKSQILETASVLVPFLSAPFCTQSATLNLLHICILLARSRKILLQPLTISHLPRHPSFLHLLPTAIHCEDQASAQCLINLVL